LADHTILAAGLWLFGFLSGGEDKTRTKRDEGNGSKNSEQNACSDEHTQKGHDDASLVLAGTRYTASGQRRSESCSPLPRTHSSTCASSFRARTCPHRLSRKFTTRVSVTERCLVTHHFRTRSFTTPLTVGDLTRSAVAASITLASASRRRNRNTPAWSGVTRIASRPLRKSPCNCTMTSRSVSASRPLCPARPRGNTVPA